MICSVQVSTNLQHVHIFSVERPHEMRYLNGCYSPFIVMFFLLPLTLHLVACHEWFLPECRLVVICSKEREDRSRLVAALDKHRINAPNISKMTHVQTYLKRHFQQDCAARADNLHHAAEVDPERYVGFRLFATTIAINTKRSGLMMVSLLRLGSTFSTHSISRSFPWSSLVLHHDFSVSSMLLPGPLIMYTLPLPFVDLRFHFHFHLSWHGGDCQIHYVVCLNCCFCMHNYRVTCNWCVSLEYWLNFSFNKSTCGSYSIDSSWLQNIVDGFAVPRCSVRVVKSDRAGVGKSLRVKRLAEELTALNGAALYQGRKSPVCVTVTLQQKAADHSDVLRTLVQHTMAPDKPVPRVFHFDIAHEVTW